MNNICYLSFIIFTYAMLIIEFGALSRTLYSIFTSGTWKKLEIRLILYICGSDLAWCLYTIIATTLYVCLDFNRNSPEALISRAFFNSMFIDCSVSFAVIISYSAQCTLTVQGFSLDKNFSILQIFGFGIPAVISILQQKSFKNRLATTNFMNKEDKKSSPLFWTSVLIESFYQTIAITICLLCYRRIYQGFKKLNVPQIIREEINNLLLFPLIMIICVTIVKYQPEEQPSITVILYMVLQEFPDVDAIFNVVNNLLFPMLGILDSFAYGKNVRNLMDSDLQTLTLFSNSINEQTTLQRTNLIYKSQLSQSEISLNNRKYNSA